MTSSYAPTVRNDVYDFESKIESYGDNGAIRALAQEPVQNSNDARHNSPVVTVEYRLHAKRDPDGRPYHLLSVTDTGTYGLRGPALSRAEVAERGYILNDDENWAAFEGQGYTKKSNELAGGKRGQGKSAFLYHSNPPFAALDRRMMMLYDSLRADGVYRLGVRNVNPEDGSGTPLEYTDAETVMRGHFTDETGLDIHLGLDPLTQVGTRVIVPYLSDKAVNAIKNGELTEWLQRCWWRAIQTEELEIRVIDEETDRNDRVEVPSWWQDEPWIGAQPEGVEVRSTENVDLGDGLPIKRIVLLYNEALESSDAGGDDAEFDGVQLLRGKQWITTIGSRQHFGSVVPRDKRPGFRGFVEFEQSLEKMLRDMEYPQHHKFDRRQGLVQDIYREVERAVEDFAVELGWSAETQRPRRPAEQPNITRELLQWLAPNARGPRPTPTPQKWDCLLSLTLPDPKVARVNLGQRLENVRVQVTSPAPHPAGVTVSLEAHHAEEDLIMLIQQRDLSFYQRDGDLNLGSFQVVRNSSRDDQIELPAQGKWTLVGRVHQDGRQVARASRAFFLNEDPPETPHKPLTVSISAENRTRSVPGRERINYGERVAVLIHARNGTTETLSTTLSASIAGVPQMLADGVQQNLRGTPGGDTLDRQDIWSGDVIFCPPNEMPLSVDDAIVFPVEPGRHRINVDLRDTSGQVTTASASYTLLIETDSRNQDWLPFRVQERNGDIPRWQLKEEDGELLLLFPAEYATLRSLRNTESDSATSGRNAFLFEITCEALIQWALEPVWNRGDRTNLDELCAGQPAGVELPKWEQFVESLERLERSGGGNSELLFVDAAKDFRGCAAQLMRLYEESH